MSQVYEIEKDLTHSAVMCKSGKHYLTEVQKGLTAFGFVLLAKHRKRQIYKYILKELERIRDINVADCKIDRLLDLHEFPTAIQLAQQCSEKIESSAQYTCIANITAGFESSSARIMDKIDSTFLENQVKHILGSCSPSFKIEEFLKVLESVNQFIDVGHEFSSDDASLLKTAMHQQSHAYFENFHKKRIEDLRTMLENEMWNRMPLPNDFTVLSIQEFGGVMAMTDNNTATGSHSWSATPMVGSPLLSLNLGEPKPVSFNPSDHDVPFFNNFKQDGNPFSLKEGRKTLSEAAGDRIQGGSATTANNGEATSAAKTNSPLISSTTINVVRLFGKYLQMMKILKHLAYPIFTAISQLLEYYVYSVFIFFGECSNTNLFDQGHDSISNISPILKKTMLRLKQKFNPQPVTPSSTTSSLLASSTHLFQSKLSSSPMSLRSSVDNTRLSPSPSPLSLQSGGGNGNGSSEDVGNVRWELRDVPTDSSPYTKQIFILFHGFAGHLDEISKRTKSLPTKVWNLLWENTITYAMETLIEAFSRIRKCNNHGRTLMTMDLKALQSSLEQLTTIRPIPHLQHVDKYIKAYFLPEEDIYNLARDSEYTIKQVIGIVHVVNHLKKPQKQKLISDLEELEKVRKIEASRQ
eukprot:gene7473-8744_t